MREWLRIIRKDRKMSEKDVADAVGISQPNYHRIEAGQQNPSVQTAKRIADVLGFYWAKFYDKISV